MAIPTQFDQGDTPPEYSGDSWCYYCGTSKGKLYLDDTGHDICARCEREQELDPEVELEFEEYKRDE